MGLISSGQLLKQLLSQPAWSHQKRFAAVAQCWQEILPQKSLANSLPVQIIDDVLWIATPNHTWSQHLNLQRRRILHQLNAQIDPPLKEIRFSTVHWHRKPAYSPLAADPNLPHPSQIPLSETIQAIAPCDSQDPVAVVRHWAETQQKMLAGLPPCPRCHRPTPPGELTRWQMCTCCIVQVWQTEQSDFCLGLPPTSPGSEASTD
ncbi:DciA family protein [Picosynechococcus sp. NKBG15041c]|uniref:DciA family protein n=1 Tax=Picosynechococcus sp. NKBG15041c TaxID=1407650 RepID=UPI000429DF45|nr:DUF721 domain-containing protein [Picosynechococcus sp. NKBG15041c]